MGSLNIREAEDDDWPRVGALSALLVSGHHAYDAARFIPPEALPPETYVERLKAERASGRATVLVADIAGRVMGYAFVGIKAESWKELRHEAGYIHDLVVDPQARRQGAATGLLARAADWFAARGVRRIMLWTAVPNAQAQALFTRAGFRPTMLELTRELG